MADCGASSARLAFKLLQVCALKPAGIIGGAKWEGKKTVIVDDDEAVEQASAENGCEASPAAEATLPSSSPCAAGSVAAKSFKYAKIVRKLLRQVRLATVLGEAF